MSLKTFVVQIEETALHALKEAGHVLEAFVLTEGQKLVAEVKQSDVGTLALNLISDINSSSLSGSEKMAKVISDVIPALQKFEANGGLKGLTTSIEDFAREFCQSLVNDFKSNVLGKLPA